ncbi:MAG: proP5 [Alphaproteobacteria bacterium]|jgi:MHS family proline/betaine transporter-like MFS transporter|nr:proP5 [Alphaproteobacteria bacterium]
MRKSTKKTVLFVHDHLQKAHIHEKPLLQKPPPVKAPVFFISVLGTILEYFEYAIYGFLAPVLALHFFPSGDPTTALLKTFGVFAVGSLSKPLGALIFGYLGDMRGRRISLRYSMIGISFPTFIVGLLPGYDSWGWAAAFALVLCRMCQGIFLAGESDGVQIYVFEHFGLKNPCLMANLAQCGAYIGIALASFVASQIPLQGENWRFVFLGCSGFGVIVFMLRRYLIETPPFLAYQQKRFSPLSLKQIVQTYWAAILRTIMICGASGGAYHFYLVFQGTYVSKILKIIPLEQGTLYSFWLTSLYVLTLPLAGWAADSWGLARIGTVGGVTTLGLVALNAVMLNRGIIFLPTMILTTIAMVFFLAPGYLFLMQQYDVSVRFRCLSLGHTIGSMLFSGTTPFMCLLLWQSTALPYVPYLYFLCLITLGLGAFIWGERDQRIQSPGE